MGIFEALRGWCPGCVLCRPHVDGGVGGAKETGGGYWQRVARGKDRYLAHVSTDKPVYGSGEKVYVRAVILQAADHMPVGSANAAVVQILGPKGETVVTAQASVEHGVCGFAWDVPDGQAGASTSSKSPPPIWASRRRSGSSTSERIARRA